MLRFKYIFGFILFSLFACGISACTDDVELYPPSQQEEEDFSFVKGVPEDMLEGYTISFRLSVDPMGGESMGLDTRAEDILTNERLRYIENFVDLEKLRVLFFTCLDNDDIYGQSDIFLFESKSRWVSVLSSTESTSANWMVTSPVFTYGNNEEYDWDMIQEILRERPFKVAILANRPDMIRYSDFDTTDGGEFSFPNHGPEWGKEQSDLAIKDYLEAKKRGFKGLVKPEDNGSPYEFQGISVNGLHHCQWDPVYAFKNSQEKAKDNSFYDFIILNPDHNDLMDQTKNWMGACSYWTNWEKDPVTGKYYDNGQYTYNSDGTVKKYPTKFNWYRLPNEDQGIPMYGIQKFNRLENWLEGTPFNISDRQVGDDGNYVRKNIHLLRSLARLDLIVPKSLGEVIYQKKGTAADFPATCLMYSNVFGRCEPMDVATPTEQIWASNHRDNGDVNTRCEFWNIYKYGPIINKDNSNEKPSQGTFQKVMAWFYGSWKNWGWNFENGRSTLPSTSTKFDEWAMKMNNDEPMPYPRIFNPCIQRNQYAYLDNVCISSETDSEYHFVVYTGERNINDPNGFDVLVPKKGELAYFFLRIKVAGESTARSYIIPLSNHTNNANNLAKTEIKRDGSVAESISETYKEKMGNSTTQTDWNWPLLRNHVYTFRVLGIGGKTDKEGMDGLIISSEDRSTPFIDYY